MAISSASRTAPAVRLAAWPQQVPTWLVVLLLGGVALVPRALGLNDFYTVDEAYHWPARTRAFAEAVLAHDWARTNQTGHPGVTTMWLGSLGYWLAGWMQIAPPGRTGDGTLYLALLRLPLAIANGLAVLGGYALLRRLLAPATAMLAALLWATAPFLVAHSRVLHLDALLTTCLALSLLCLLVATAAPADAADRAAAQNQRATFLATHPAALLDEWFPKACGLVTLSRHDEGRPQVMLEAMAAGLPVLASDLPAHRDMIQHRQTGWLATSPTDLAQAITWLEDPLNNLATSQAARQWVKDTVGGWDDCASRYAAAYQTLLEPGA